MLNENIPVAPMYFAFNEAAEEDSSTRSCWLLSPSLLRDIVHVLACNYTRYSLYSYINKINKCYWHLFAMQIVSHTQWMWQCIPYVRPSNVMFLRPRFLKICNWNQKRVNNQSLHLKEKKKKKKLIVMK